MPLLVACLNSEFSAALVANVVGFDGVLKEDKFTDI